MVMVVEGGGQLMELPAGGVLVFPGLAAQDSRLLHVRLDMSGRGSGCG